MNDVVMPEIGVSMDEGVLSRWLKQPGEPVAEGEPIAEIETDKAAVELESPSDGVLGRHHVEEGATALVGALLVRVLAPGEIEGDAAAPPAAAPAPAPSAAAPAPAVAPSPGGDAASLGASPAGGRPHRLTPRARRLAREHGIPYGAVGGSGRAGDVLALVAAGGPGLGAAASGNGAPAGGSFRELIARKVTEAWQTIPHFAVTREIDAEELLAFASWSKREGLPVTVTDLLLVALARAVATADVPSPALGLAVATDRGVLIPVIRDVAGLGLAGLAAERAQAIERARSGRLSAADLGAPPASTLSNLGAFGVDQFTGVIAAGQPTLLTVGRIRDRVVVRGRALEARPTLFATLNVDHRALDGSDAAKLLDRFATAVERPEGWERSRD
ncbi:MAG TPA: dihydrolipoamide acetyltransferase family protein [Gaiellales bacterium]|nr:dihydrolipoamide acetyltransferase family protein [Gaiellales bacterium]